MSFIHILIQQGNKLRVLHGKNHKFLSLIFQKN